MWEQLPAKREDRIAVMAAERFAEFVAAGDWKRAQEWAEAAFRRWEEVTIPDDALQ